MLPFYSAILSILRKKQLCPNCREEFIITGEEKKKQTATCPHCKKKISIKPPGPEQPAEKGSGPRRDKKKQG